MECNIKIVKLKQVLPLGTFPKREHNVRYFYHRTDGCYYMYDEKGCEINLTTDGDLIPINRELIVGSESLTDDTLVCIGLKANYVHPSVGIRPNGCCCQDTYIKAWTYLKDLQDFLQTGHIDRNYYRISLVPSPEEGGIVGCTGASIIPDEDQDGFRFQFEAGSKVILYAKPAIGYHFVGWKEYHSNEIMSISADWTFNIKKDMDLIGVFAKDVAPEESFYINTNAQPSNGGYTVGSGVFPKGTKHSITAAAIKGYHFVCWKNSANVVVSTNLQYDFVVTKEETFTAYFEEDIPTQKYRVDIAKTPSDKGEVLGAGEYNVGDIARIIPTPANGWRVDSVIASTSGLIEVGDGTYTIVVKKDTIIFVKFTEEYVPPVQYSVQISAKDNGLCQYRIGKGEYSEPLNNINVDVVDGSSLEVVAVPNVGYAFSKWNINGVDNQSNPCTLVVNKNSVLSCSFKEVPAETVNISVETDGTNEARYRIGTNDWSNWSASKQTFNVTVGSIYSIEARGISNYSFKDWSTDGVKSTKNPIVFTAQSGINASHIASFEQIIKRSLTLIATNGGKCRAKINDVWSEYYTGSHVFSDILDGSNVTIEAVANTGYHFNKWSDLSSGSTATRIVTIDSDKTITAEFEANVVEKFNVTATINPSNAAVITGTGSYDKGATCKIKVVTNSGYNINQVSIDGVKVTLDDNNEYSFIVSKDTAIVVDCNAVTPEYTVIVKTESGDISKGTVGIGVNSGLATDTLKVNKGAIVRLRAVPAKDYNFEGWFKENESNLISTEADHNITVNEDITLIAKFTQGAYLNLSVDSLDFSADGETKTINVTSNVDWTVS